MRPAPLKKKDWPRWAVGPLGNRAIFHCAGDVPPKWRLETPLPGSEPAEAIALPGMPSAPEPKNKGGRPRKHPVAE